MSRAGPWGSGASQHPWSGGPGSAWTRPPSASSQAVSIGTTSVAGARSPVASQVASRTRPGLGRQEESTAARTSWPQHMQADQQGSPGYERGARRAPREPGGEFSPRAGCRSVEHRARHPSGGGVGSAGGGPELGCRPAVRPRTRGWSPASPAAALPLRRRLGGPGSNRRCPRPSPAAQLGEVGQGVGIGDEGSPGTGVHPGHEAAETARSWTFAPAFHDPASRHQRDRSFARPRRCGRKPGPAAT